MQLGVVLCLRYDDDYNMCVDDYNMCVIIYSMHVVAALAILEQ